MKRITGTFAGIGSRETPSKEAGMMRDAARRLAAIGYGLTSGGARKKKGNTDPNVFSADEVFELAYNEANGYARIIVAELLNKHVILENNIYWGGINHIEPSEKHMSIAESFVLRNNIIPWFNKMGRYPQLLHCRNFWQIVYMSDLHKTVDFVICYSPLDSKGEPTGGTRTAIKIAEHFCVPVFNLAKPVDCMTLETVLCELEESYYG